MANKPGYYSKYYEQNREALIVRSAATTRKRREKLRLYLRELKCNAICPDCKRGHPDHPWRMTFDHLPQFTKQANIADLIKKGWSWERSMAEIAKCEIVCLLCHADRTQARGISANGNT